MATDTTALAEASAAMRAAVAHGDVMDEAHRRCPTSASEGRLLQAAGYELDAGRALLAALDGIPERIAALEAQADHFRRTLASLQEAHDAACCQRDTLENKHLRACEERDAAHAALAALREGGE